MNPCAGSPDTATDPAAERLARQTRLLAELAEMGMELARDLRDQAKAPAEARPDAAHLAQAFARIARAVRMTLLLETRLAEDQAARDRDDPLRRRALSQARRDARWAARPPAERRRDVAHGVVSRMIEAYAEGAPWRADGETYAEAERLIDEDLTDADILNRPIADVIKAICEALRVRPDWSLWDPADWTDEDWGLTPAEIAEAYPAGTPKRLKFPEPKAAEAAAEPPDP